MGRTRSPRPPPPPSRLCFCLFRLNAALALLSAGAGLVILAPPTPRGCLWIPGGAGPPAAGPCGREPRELARRRLRGDPWRSRGVLLVDRWRKRTREEEDFLWMWWERVGGIWGGIASHLSRWAVGPRRRFWRFLLFYYFLFLFFTKIYFRFQKNGFSPPSQKNGFSPPLIAVVKL